MRKLFALIKRYYGDLNRDLDNIFLAIRVYGTTTIIVFIVFGLCGIWPLTSVVINKIKTAQELQTANKEMENNLIKLEAVRTQLRDNAIYIDYLNSYVPLSPDTQVYLLEFVDAVGKSGYAVKSFTQAEQNPDKTITELNISMEGTAYPDTLVKQVESLARVTNLKSMIFYSESRLGVPTYTVNMTVQIYSYIEVK